MGKACGPMSRVFPLSITQAVGHYSCPVVSSGGLGVRTQGNICSTLLGLPVAPANREKVY